MSEKSPLKTVLKTSLPAVIDLSSQTFMWTIEAILIGKISAAAFGGVGMAVQIIVVVLTILLTFIVGSSIIINRYLGAKNYWDANHIMGQALMLGIIMAILIAIGWYFGAPYIFKLIKEGGSEARQAGITYLKTIALFAPLVLTNFVALGIVRGAGDTRYAMMINLSVNSLNLVLAPTLIFGLFGFPRLEVRGAAIAMCSAHSLGFFATLYLLRSRKSVLFLSFRELTTPNFRTFKRLFKAGLPTTVEQLVWAFGQLVVTGYAAVIGITVLAAHQVFLRIQAILSMFYLGFGIGAMTLVGKNLGADDRKTAEKTALTANAVVFVFACFVFIVIAVFSKPLIAMFTSEPEVVKLGSSVIIVFALVQIPKAMDGVLIGNLRGVGDLKWLMWVTIASVLIFEISLNWSLVFLLNFSLMALWLVHLGDEILRTIINFWRFKSGKWKFIHY
ncbi:MATE family efflux transporter [candidate division KSB1 bacterium]|nr:MATE family efflux transporter [candidate division KSB1 bacterium]NIR69955.1 MATE family efflux transporter [candidate division KSB1 bacterium]NIS25854.1 MATE family efflux transporter [candidate division KSB1 bacterium]NIT72731.1 MATE family efflux transporter [candidate division KSB1 bacterium]NIU26543.1 MATE family efflux transporter [candidate division KSB1 bacterium]